MRLFVLILLAISATAHAQFGIGLQPGSSCGNQFGPAGGAMNGQDELSNLNGQFAARERRIDQLRAKEDHLNEYISRAKSDMAEVITAKGFAAIREHRERNNNYGSYRLQCGGGAGPAGGEVTDPELFSTAPRARMGDDGGAQYPPPDAFCVKNPATGQRENVWEKFVEDDGTVSDRLCDFRIAGVTRPASRIQRDRCREGMHEYYERMEEKMRLRDEIARLDNELRHIGRRIERVHDEITEGTYCPWCAAQRRGYSNMGAGNSMMQGGGLLNMLGALLGGGQRQPMMGQPMMGQPMMMGGPQPMMMGPPMAGPGFPVRPYSASIPGYYGVQPGPQPGMGTYGGVPGGIGPGGFGCQGANPAAFGSPFGSPMVNPIFGGPSPFNNPYANPAMMPMFNQGAGPGWGFPMYANGMPGFQNPYGMNPYAMNPYAMNPYGMNPNGMNPYGMGPYGMNPYAMNPYGMNPYGMNPYGMNPYGMNPYGMNPYGMNPYGLGPYGMNPYGMSPFPSNPFTMNPYGAYNPYGYAMPYGPGYGSPYGAGGVMPTYGYNPYGAPYYGSPVGNYFGEVGLMNTRLQMIQNGGYYGGGYAPPVMPYLTTPNYFSSPNYQFGAPRGNAPAVLPYVH